MRCYICDHSPDAPSVLREGEPPQYNPVRYIKEEKRWLCSKCNSIIQQSEYVYEVPFVLDTDFDEGDT